MPSDWSKRYRRKNYALGDPVFFGACSTWELCAGLKSILLTLAVFLTRLRGYSTISESLDGVCVGLIVLKGFSLRACYGTGCLWRIGI